MSNFFAQVLANPSAAMKALKDQPDRGLVILLEALQHNDPNVRLNTIRNMFFAFIWQKGNRLRPILEKLVAILHDDANANVHLHVIELLQRYDGDKSDRDVIFPAVSVALAHPEKSVRSAGLRLFQRFDRDTLLPDIDRVIADETNQDTRYRALVIRAYTDKQYTHDDLVEAILNVCLQNDYYWKDMGYRCFRSLTKETHGDALQHALQHMNLDSQLGQSLKNSIEKVVGPAEQFTPDATVFKLANIDVQDYTDLDGNWQKVERALSTGEASFYTIGHSLYLQGRRQKLEDLYKTVLSLAESDQIRAQFASDYERVQNVIRRMES